VVRNPAGLGEIFLLQNVQTGCEAHTTSHSTGVRGSLPADKAVEKSI